MSLSFETKPKSPVPDMGSAAEGMTQVSEEDPATLNPENIPNCLFYASTLRWMDKVKVSDMIS